MITQGLQIAEWTSHIGNHHPFYMAVIDANAHISFVNSHFLRTFQQISMPPNRKQFNSLVHDSNQTEFLEAVTSALHEEQPVKFTTRMKAGSGKMISWELRRFDTGTTGSPKIFCLGFDTPAENQPCHRSDNTAAGKNPQKKLAESIIRAQHQERARIGHELHDNVNQILTSVQLYASCLARENDDFDYVKNKVMDTILLAIEEVRSLSRDMVMPDLKGQGLIECLDKLIADLRYNKRLELDFRHGDRMTIEAQDPQLKLTVYRIIQEQIKNILKHSHATHVDLNLHAGNDQIRLMITDNGQGFDPKTTASGLGLSGIRERIELYGGKMALRTAPGHGCTLIITIPLEPRRIF